MTSENLLREAAGRFRQAVASEAHDDTLLALADYRRHLDATLAASPSDGPPPVELTRESCELMQWALQVVRSARARARDQLEQAAAVLQYRDPARQVRTWKIDG